MIKEGDVYGMKAPNGVTIEAYALHLIKRSLPLKDSEYSLWLMYSQNRLFILLEFNSPEIRRYHWIANVCNYCIIPEADKILEDCNEYAAHPKEWIEDICYAV